MYDDTPRRLTHNQVIDNSLLLILAGSDTSAGTLTAAIFSMGLKPNVWRQVVEEQQELIKRHGSKLDKSQLDQRLSVSGCRREGNNATLSHYRRIGSRNKRNYSH